MSNPTDDPRKWPPIITAIAALQSIADLPTGANADIESGREDAYRAIEALFAEPPEIEANPNRYAASPSSPASGVRVKALEWVQSSFGGQAWRAHSILGLYRVAMGSTAGWAFEGYDGTEVSQRADNIDAAKAAAQADYEARIRSALGEHP